MCFILIFTEKGFYFIGLMNVPNYCIYIIVKLKQLIEMFIIISFLGSGAHKLKNMIQTLLYIYIFFNYINVKV